MSIVYAYASTHAHAI